MRTLQVVVVRVRATTSAFVQKRFFGANLKDNDSAYIPDMR